MFKQIKKTLIAASMGMLVFLPILSTAEDLGIEGQVFDIIEEDFRITLMRMVARYNWDDSVKKLEDSARNYTKNLPPLYLPPAQETKTVWKDVGIVLTEDIEVPYVDWQTGSVLDPQPVVALQAGTYLNPIQQMPSAAIERLFVFDGLDPDQLALAKALMVEKTPFLSFMAIAGDVGEMAKEMNMPVFYPAPTMLEKFHITAVPTLIGFGKGQHLGHMALTQFKLPTTRDTIYSAWYGLPYEGYDPTQIPDFSKMPEPDWASEAAAEAAYILELSKNPSAHP